MCEDCEEALQTLKMYGHISSLMDAWAMGSSQDYEYSEPFFCGGPASVTGSVYSVRAPFQGPCQFMVDFATTGTVATHMICSSFAKRTAVDFSSTATQGYNDSMMDGLVLFAPPNQTVPISSSWYDIRNSENTVYVLVQAATGVAGGVNIQFRQKRKTK